MFPLSAPMAALWGRHYNPLHFTGEEADAQKCCDLPGIAHPIISNSLGVNPGSLASKSLLLTTTQYRHSVVLFLLL